MNFPQALLDSTSTIVRHIAGVAEKGASELTPHVVRALAVREAT